MGGGGGNGEADARYGMIQVNDLVYKLDTDLSVAVNRTHKINFFQNQEYGSGQTSIAIINSGADYVDPRRSFMAFDVVIPATPTAASLALIDSFISCYFGKNGSVLNLIDSVVVSTRSGDELSRVNDFGQLQNILVPEMFGNDYQQTIGQLIGLGSYIGGSGTYASGVPPAVAVSEQRNRRFCIPLYLLSPIFNYGRLLPSMLMSGLRIEIKWKPLVQAVQQFWEGALTYESPFGSVNAPPVSYQDNDADLLTEFKTAFAVSAFTDATASGLSPVAATTADTYAWADAAGVNVGFTILTLTPANAFAGLWTGFNLLDPKDNTQRFWRDGTTLVIPIGSVLIPGSNPPAYSPRIEFRFVVQSILSNATLLVNFTPADGGPVTATYDPDNVNPYGVYRVNNQMRQAPYTRDFGAPVLSGRGLTLTTPLTDYTIQSPSISLCSIQLTDAIQRTLNEFSSVNGLEVVYADYDRTSVPISTGTNAVYLEVRKSASRALQAFARVTPTTVDSYRYDSFASIAGSFWNHYQWQLGSLYFPNQRVQDNNSILEIARDNMVVMAYAYCQDAFDRFHPKAAPTMSTLRGYGVDYDVRKRHPTEISAEHGPSAYLAPQSSFGKWGSFANGATTIATTLERSTLFDLSGIPINNSRVLALRGEVFIPEKNAAHDILNGTLWIFLKYVRMARTFLVNTEVEQ